MTATPIPGLIAPLTDEQVIAALASLFVATLADLEAAVADLAEANRLLATVRRYHGRAINVLQGAERSMG